jgi:hypothetical protein
MKAQRQCMSKTYTGSPQPERQRRPSSERARVEADPRSDAYQRVHSALNSAERATNRESRDESPWSASHAEAVIDDHTLDAAVQALGSSANPVQAESSASIIDDRSVSSLDSNEEFFPSRYMEKIVIDCHSQARYLIDRVITENPANRSAIFVACGCDIANHHHCLLLEGGNKRMQTLEAESIRSC